MEEMKVIVNGEEKTITEVENLLNEQKSIIEELKSQVSMLSVKAEEAEKSKAYWYENYSEACIRSGNILKSMDALRNVVNEIADRWK